MTKKIITTAGRDELSEEDIEALADEAERGYDLTKATRVTFGRPSLGATAEARRPRLPRTLNDEAPGEGVRRQRETKQRPPAL
jgi:hypothetical protein